MKTTMTTSQVRAVLVALFLTFSSVILGSVVVFVGALALSTVGISITSRPSK